MEMKLEVVVLPVSDVDRAKDFYKSLDWRLDADFVGDEGFRVVQLTPPGSACSVIFGSGITSAIPGSVQGLHLVVSDAVAARGELVGRRVEVSEVFHDAGGVFHHEGTAERVVGPDPRGRSYASFASFSDPDGNGWVPGDHDSPARPLMPVQVASNPIARPTTRRVGSAVVTPPRGHEAHR